MQTADHEWQPALSPDGTLVAYVVGDPNDTPQVVLRRYPVSDELWQVSAVGTVPSWSPDSKTLYFKDISVRSSASTSRASPQWH